MLGRIAVLRVATVLLMCTGVSAAAPAVSRRRLMAHFDVGKLNARLLQQCPQLWQARFDEIASAGLAHRERNIHTVTLALQMHLQLPELRW
jgi:hypothetical protein